MMAGAPSVYCDFTDYDEIAHHAGPTRPESLASLNGIDQLIGVLEEVAEGAPRRYEFVVLSDHGQSQGATFRQRFGSPLQDVVRQLMDSGSVAASTGLDETVGPVNTFLTQLAEQGGTAGRLTRRAFRTRTHDGQVEVDSDLGGAGDAEDADQVSPARASASDLVLIASGNLSMIYFTRRPGRLTLDEIEQLYPGLVAGLTAHPGVGFVVARTGDGTSVVLGSTGIRHLGTGVVEGTDPLADFGPHAVDDVTRHDTLANVGDLVINSPIDQGTEEVAAYEELVGCHGGLGGWQTEAVLVHPAGWPLDEQPLVGADAVHRQLVRWLEALGQRRGLTVTPTPQPAPEQQPEQQPAGPASGATPGEVPSPGTGRP